MDRKQLEAIAFPIVFAAVAVAGVALWGARRSPRLQLPGFVWPVTSRRS